MLFGCVYNPYTREMYSAVKGEGAKLNGKEIHCSDKGLADNLVASELHGIRQKIQTESLTMRRSCI